jgi:DNA (cytosine-5)-methyltransferase 1
MQKQSKTMRRKNNRWQGKYRIHPQIGLNFSDGLIVDNFAGGGGASTGIEAAIGRPVDIAINHDPGAVRMHMVNHPHTRHLCESVWAVDPVAVCAERPVELMWLSPDCKHFSKAKGGRLVDKGIRGLAWIAAKWAGKKQPRVIILENVEEFRTWGPLVAKRCRDTGRVWKTDGTVAEPGERVPLEDQYLVPDPKRRGKYFRRLVQTLRGMGYQVEHRELRACDFGAPTSRKRLFMVARCDGQPIVWPEPTHGPGLTPYRTAAEIIDFSLPCPSIFERKRPLAENTLRRIARGIQRYVLENPEPFIVSYYGPKAGEKFRGQGVREPLRTQTTENRFGLVTPVLVGAGGPSYSGKPRPVDRPVGTLLGENHTALVAPVIVGCGGKTGLATSHLVKLRGTCKDGQPATEPMPTVTAGGLHIGEVRAFLMKYYSSDQDPNLREPLHTITTKGHFGLVTVKSHLYQIADIGMRMLTPRELFLAQGFPADYIIDRDAEGRPITATDQVARCGNSVPPVFAEALVRANVVDLPARVAA